MKLRLRFALTAVAVMVPVIPALFWFDAAAPRRAAEQVLTAFVVAEMPAQRALCEASPASWGGVLAPFGHQGPPPGGAMPPPPPGAMPPPPDGPARPRARPAEAFAYDAALRSQNPSSPALSSDLARALAGRDLAVAAFGWRSSEVEVLLRMPWSGGP